MRRGAHGTQRLALVLTLTVVAAVVPAAAASATAPPHPPVLVAPAEGATLSASGPQIFTIRTSDPDGEPYSGWITVADPATGSPLSTFPTAPARSGDTSSGVPGTPLPRGS